MKRILIAATVLAVSAACSDYELSGPDDGPPAGPQPDIKIEPETIGFGYLPVECPSGPELVTVSNVGAGTLEVSDIKMIGPAANSFDILGTPTNLEPGESFTFEVEFAANSLGDFDAAARVISNDPDEAEADVLLVGHGSENAMAEDIFIQASPNGVDVLWVLDNSCSMSDLLADVSASLGSFVNNFVNLGLDYQLGITTTDMVAADHQGRLQGIGVISPATTGDVISEFSATVSAQGSNGSADERGLDAAHAALTSPILDNENAGLVREDAHLAVIVVTDEEDGSSIDPTTFANWLNGYKGDPDLTSFSAIAGPEGFGMPDMSCAFSGGSAQGTTRYPTVIDATGGVHSEICGTIDTDEVLTHLSWTAAGMQTVFELSKTPTNTAQITVEVDGVSVPVARPSNGFNGYSYDGATNTVEIMGTAVPGPESEIIILYPVASDC